MDPVSLQTWKQDLSTSINSTVGPRPSELLRPLGLLAQEENPQLYLQGVLYLAHRAQAQGRDGEAALLYQWLISVTAGDEACQKIHRECQAEWQDMQGKGGWGSRVQNFSKRLIIQGTKPSFWLPAVVGSLAFQVGRSRALTQLAGSRGVGVAALSLGDRILGAAAGLSLELPVFVLAQNWLEGRWSGTADWTRQGMFFSIGRLGGFVGGQVALRSRLGPGGVALAVLPRWQKISHAGMVAASQLISVLVAQRLEVGVGLREELSASAGLWEAMAGMGQWHLGMQVAQRFLGPKYRQLEHELNQRLFTFPKFNLMEALTPRPAMAVAGPGGSGLEGPRVGLALAQSLSDGPAGGPKAFQPDPQIVARVERHIRYAMIQEAERLKAGFGPRLTPSAGKLKLDLYLHPEDGRVLDPNRVHGLHPAELFAIRVRADITENRILIPKNLREALSENIETQFYAEAKSHVAAGVLAIHGKEIYLPKPVTPQRETPVMPRASSIPVSQLRAEAEQAWQSLPEVTEAPLLAVLRPPVLFGRVLLNGEGMATQAEWVRPRFRSDAARFKLLVLPGSAKSAWVLTTHEGHLLFFRGPEDMLPAQRATLLAWRDLEGNRASRQAAVQDFPYLMEMIYRRGAGQWLLELDAGLKAGNRGNGKFIQTFYLLDEKAGMRLRWNLSAEELGQPLPVSAVLEVGLSHGEGGGRPGLLFRPDYGEVPPEFHILERFLSRRVNRK